MQEKRQINKLVLGLGSNLGDRFLNLERALASIAVSVGKITRRSGFYGSKAQGYESENDFVNMVIEVETVLDPLEALSETLRIERETGRKNKSAGNIYEDRLLDIDLLFFNDEIVESEGLNIPHKNLRDRKFVLVPLVEILPELTDPKTGKTSTDLLKLTTDKSQIFLL